MIWNCLFEQSGTFKKEFRKLGFESYDYDIENQFNETDFQLDLFAEIEKAYNKEPSIFDKMTDQGIIAFFPCIRFEAQIIMFFRGDQSSQKKWNDRQKLEYNIKIHKELSLLYDRICKLAIICIDNNIKLIIENPYNGQHYLTRYWCIKPKIIDLDRTEWGDYFMKPTQYWFINCEPKNNLVMRYEEKKPKKRIEESKRGIERSLISPDYAKRFIEEYIL